MSVPRKKPSRSGPKPKGPRAPKIPAFAFSTKNKSDAAYRDRLKTLKDKFGVGFVFKTNAKLTPQRKAAITRQTRKLKEFLNPDNSFAFVPTTRRQNKGVRRNREISKQQITKGGIFLPAPNIKGKRKTKFRVSDDGQVLSKTGNFTSHFQLFRSVDVANDPGIIQRAAEKLGAETVFVSIKGHRGGSRKNGYSLKAFMRYLAENIIPDIEEAQEDEDKKTAFRNWFGVELVTYDWSAGPGKNRKNRKSKTITKRKAKK